eukprot:jgi/Chlat1/706/Chrsp104S01210
MGQSQSQSQSQAHPSEAQSLGGGGGPGAGGAGVGSRERRGWRFLSEQEGVEAGWWRDSPLAVPRLNPPSEELLLPFRCYGQAFYKGYDWEKKV